MTALEANQYINGFLKTLPGDISVRPLLLACAQLRVSPSVLLSKIAMG